MRQVNTPSQKQIAEDWYEILVERLTDNIEKLKIGKTHRLVKSFNKHIQLGGNADLERIKITFDLSGAFTDMGVGRGQKIESVKENRSKWASALGEKSKRRPKKWYSKTMFSEYNKLIEILSDYYQVTASKKITESMETGANSKIQINL